MASASLCCFQVSQNFSTPSLNSFSTNHSRYSSSLNKTSNFRRLSVLKDSSSVVFRDLDADDFRHPLDKQNTLLLRTIPGLNELGKAILGTVGEQVMVLENIGTSVLVAKNQAPDLYVRQSPVPNAYTLAVSGRKPFVVVHTSLVELLSRKELQTTNNYASIPHSIFVGPEWRIVSNSFFGDAEVKRDHQKTAKLSVHSGCNGEVIENIENKVGNANEKQAMIPRSCKNRIRRKINITCIWRKHIAGVAMVDGSVMEELNSFILAGDREWYHCPSLVLQKLAEAITRKRQKLMEYSCREINRMRDYLSKQANAVLAHELGHLKCDHGVWLTFANILALGAYTVPGLGGMIARSLEEQLFRWLRAAELTCDRAALLVAQDPKKVIANDLILWFYQEVVISVLMKLAGGCPSLSDQLNVDAFLEQARSYDKASSSPFGWNAQTSQLSHPLPVLRAREIDEWSKSKEYLSLLRRATQRSSTESVTIP
ncbi:hypothetical protein IFM89_002778 [Coptis chinensis]|uniref:Peptidase M48 domain-containing protein n=1 Tax=Coptis chinensis TaxID=261450 RepID=A0A835LQA3_9MAGN|nr:hypothetical protein IFM89_002778 [Coptis chinensis]